MTPQDKQNPVPATQQEKRWTLNERYQIVQGTRVIGFGVSRHELQHICDAHNATLSEPKESEEERAFNEHVKHCEQCSGPDDGCEEGQQLEERYLRSSEK